MLIDVPQNEKVEMGMLKECVLDVVKKGIMPIAVHKSVRRLDPVILDYIASSVEKMDILPVDVKRKMIINSMTEVHEDLRGDTRPQTRRNNQALFKSLYQDTNDGPTKLRKKNG